MPVSLDDTQLHHLRDATALDFWRLDAVRVRADQPFRLASGNHSPIYVNCRRVISSPRFMRLFVAATQVLLEQRGVTVDAFAGGETAGIPFAAFLSAMLGKPMVYVRKKPKGYGLATKVEGHLESGARTLLVEDLITDGGSKIGFLDALAEAGAEVRDALVLFDREQGGTDTLAARGVTLHAVVDLTSTLDAGTRGGALAAADRREVDAYLADPASWHAARGLDFQA